MTTTESSVVDLATEPIDVLDGSLGYDLTPAIEASCLDFARTVGERLDREHRMLVGDCHSVAGALGRLTEQRLFDGEWDDHSPALMTAEYGPYERQSTHAVIVDSEGVVATARNIWSPNLALPTKVEVDLGASDGSFRRYHRIAERYGSIALSELATVAVDPRARGGRVTGWILGEMRYQQMCLRAESPSCAMMRTSFFRLIEMWGSRMCALGGREPSEYLQVMSQPAFFEPGIQEQMAEAKGALFKALNSGYFPRVQRPLAPPLLSDLHATGDTHIDLTLEDVSPSVQSGT